MCFNPKRYQSRISPNGYRFMFRFGVGQCVAPRLPAVSLCKFVEQVTAGHEG